MKEIGVSFNDSEAYLRWVGIGTQEKAEEITRWRMIYDYELIYVQEGEIVVQEEETTYILRPHDIHIMPPGKWHKRYTLGKYKYYNFHFDIFKKGEKPFDFDIVKTYLMNEKKGSSVVFRESYYCFAECGLPEKLKVKSPNIYVVCFEEMVRLFFKQDTIARDQMNALLLYCLGLVMEQLKESDKTVVDIETVILKFESFVDNNISRDIDVELYANNAGYSYDYFRKKFRKLKGVSPQKFIVIKRMLIAKQMLQTGRYKVQELSSLLGYTSPYYFSTSFKSVIGKAPSFYIVEEKENKGD